MGLSSSQARLLHLTGRMHQIEYKAAKLEAEKLQMANESRRVYLDYQNALDSTKIQRATINTDGSLNYVDATYNALLKDGYRLGRCEYMAVTQDDIDTFNTVADKNPAEFAAIKAGYAVKQGNDVLQTANNSIQLIYTADQLKAAVANGTQNIVLMDDINVTESLGTLTSNLNGNGHTINVNSQTGIFDSINNGSVQNLAINANITGSPADNSIGALATTATGNVTIENVAVSGKIGATDLGNDVGGLIGYANNGGTLTINNITLDVLLQNSGDSGGIIGGAYNGGLDLKVSNISGNVSNINGQCGGIVGKLRDFDTNKAEISNCNLNVNLNIIKPSNYPYLGLDSSSLGGIVACGWSSADISNCYVTGSLSVDTLNATNSYANAGGIIGLWDGNNAQNISNCYTDVNISVKSTDMTKAIKGDIAGFTYYNQQKTMANCASKNGTSESDLSAIPSGLTFNEASNASSVKSLVSSAGNKGFLTQTYNPSDETTINGESTNTVGADYDYYLEMGQAIADDKYFLIDGHEDDTEWLTNLVNSGFVTIQKKDEDGKFFDTSVSTDTHLQEVADETGLRKAEAKYEADMKRIDNKDKKFDYDLAALDNERNAIKQEMETLKTVAKDNVERTFKLFS